MRPTDAALASIRTCSIRSVSAIPTSRSYQFFAEARPRARSSIVQYWTIGSSPVTAASGTSFRLKVVLAANALSRSSRSVRRRNDLGRPLQRRPVLTNSDPPGDTRSAPREYCVYTRRVARWNPLSRLATRFTRSGFVWPRRLIRDLAWDCLRWLFSRARVPDVTAGSAGAESRLLFMFLPPSRADRRLAHGMATFVELRTGTR